MTYRMEAVQRIRTGFGDVSDVELGRHDEHCGFYALHAWCRRDA